MASPTFLSTLTGSFSTGASDNPTVAIVEAAYRHHDIDARYINCEVPPEHLTAAVAGARAMGWKGFNCSIPHKVAVIQLLDGLAPSASIIGAVNCAVLRDGQLLGENTDGKGFLSTLQAEIDPKGRRLVILGAGGAAMAIAVESALAGVSHITVINRNRERGETLVRTINEKTDCQAVFQLWSGPCAIPDCDILVNATSVGLFPHHDAMPDIDLATFPSGILAADVIANPPMTRFLQAAQARDCRILAGLGMLVAQAVIGIELWTGIAVDPAVMEEKLCQIFSNEG